MNVTCLYFDTLEKLRASIVTFEFRKADIVIYCPPHRTPKIVKNRFGNLSNKS